MLHLNRRFVPSRLRPDLALSVLTSLAVILVGGAAIAGAADTITPTSAAANSVQLHLQMGDDGPASLKCGDGPELLDGNGAGALTTADATPKFAPGSKFKDGDYIPLATKRSGSTIDRQYDWGDISIEYVPDATRLTMHISVENTSATELTSLQMQLIVLKFAGTPQSSILDVGMWGKGGSAPLGMPMVVGNTLPGVLGLRLPDQSVLDYCLDANPANHEGQANATAPADAVTIGVPFTLDPKTSLAFPFFASFADLAAHSKRTFSVSLRFAPPGSDQWEVASDVINDFTTRYPFDLDWQDRRSIGMLFLSSSGIDDAKLDPRRWWVMNGTSQKVDVTTPEGLAVFAKLVMRAADMSVAVLKKEGSQGMITWDIEGQQYLPATFYGKPDLIDRLAPEMETLVDPTAPTTFDNSSSPTTAPATDPANASATNKNMIPVVDAYFKRFRDAGLRVGVCLRPQTLVFDAKGVPSQQDIDDAAAYKNLKENAAYAIKRWGCTLFYVDSTTKAGQTMQSLDPWVFDQLHRDFPGALFMPENQTVADYAVTAPLDSFMHHGVTHTSERIKRVYPKAFTVLLAAGGDFKANWAALVNGVRQGDILLYTAWFPNDNADAVAKVYADASGAAPATQSADSARPMNTAQPTQTMILSHTQPVQDAAATVNTFGLPATPSTIPVNGGSTYLMNQQDEQARQGDHPLLFLGDSITYLWQDHGKEIWNKRYAPRGALDMGIPGERTEHVLWRMDHTELKNLQPKVVVLMIGTNNISANRDAPDVTLGVTAVVRSVRQHMPNAKILLIGILPRPQYLGVTPTPICREANAELSKLADNQHIFFLDFGDQFLDKAGNVRLDLLPDRLHPSEKGFAIWADSMEPILARLLGETPAVN